MLGFMTTVSDGLIGNTDEGGGVWATEIDATAGGVTPSEAYVYATFGDQGLIKQTIDDEAALGDMAWEVAFRRYIIRVNSGDSGPSCSRVALLPSSTAFESITSLPTSLSYFSDDFMTDSCTLVTDGGLSNSPSVVLGGFWRRVDNPYGGCLQMTDRAFILELGSGRHVKVVVTHYYEVSAQEVCDTTPDTFNPMVNQGSGHIGLRWAFLD